ncbi:MAG: hypothetical protein ABL898_02120 [Hyphomicrobiaceae bacterium]|nr:hypothetical protein [Hyphomicrobiaceae bacterium]
MADGSQARIVEADRAAADAAREAKAEMLEQVKASGVTRPTTTAAKAKKATPAVAGKLGYKEFLVDVWVTNLNSVEFGFYKKSRNKAKSRQFTSDMDIFAEVIENGERTGLIGYREDLWKTATGMDKRLVFKLFNESLNWRATLDQMLGRSLQQTIGARGLPVTCFSVNVNNHDFVVYIERSANKWAFMPENFSFFFVDEGEPKFYRLRRALINLGGDYTLYDQKGDVVGYLDGKLFSFGKWRGRVRDDHADPKLLMVLQMFSAMLVFNRGCRKHVKALAREIAAGTLKPKLERQETDLYMNPRRVR